MNGRKLPLTYIAEISVGRKANEQGYQGSQSSQLEYQACCRRHTAEVLQFISDHVYLLHEDLQDYHSRDANIVMRTAIAEIDTKERRTSLDNQNRRIAAIAGQSGLGTDAATPAEFASFMAQFE